MSEHEKNELETTELSGLAPESTEKPTTSEKKPAKADKKPKPVEKKKRGGLGRYLREMKSELKKVVWPTKKQTINNTGVVILCVIIVGAFVWIFDGVASQLIGALLKIFGA